jgi:hypothetical protein
VKGRRGAESEVAFRVAAPAGVDAWEAVAGIACATDATPEAQDVATPWTLKSLRPCHLREPRVQTFCGWSRHRPSPARRQKFVYCGSPPNGLREPLSTPHAKSPSCSTSATTSSFSSRAIPNALSNESGSLRSDSHIRSTRSRNRAGTIWNRSVNLSAPFSFNQ